MHRISVPFNRQQLELLDRTLTRLGATDRAALLRQALREHGPRHQRAPAQAPAKDVR